MNQINAGREKVKTVLLALLLVASFVQIGILWGGQIHGFPFSFIRDIFLRSPAESAATDVAARQELFIPFRIIASDGNGDHWVISRQDELFQRLWSYDASKNESKNASLLIKSVTGVSPEKVYNGSEEWNRVITKKGFLFEFKSTLSKELTAWFLGVAGETPAVHKIMIIPDGEDVKNLEMYINYEEADGSEKTMKYSLGRYLWTFDSDAEEKLFNSFSVDEKYANSNCILLGELNLDIVAEADIPIAVDSPKYRPYYDLTADVPRAVANIGSENDDEGLAETILENKKDSYDRGSYDDSVQLKNVDSIYTIYKNGLLNYRYIPGAYDSDKGRIGDALMNSYKFMSRIRKLVNGKSTLYLSSVDSKNPDRYIFTFDYISGDVPIFFNLPQQNGVKDIHHAILVETNGKHVLHCVWVLMDFNKSNQFNKYNVYFLDSFGRNKAAGDSLKNKEFYVNDVNIGFSIANISARTVEPSVIIENPDNGIISIPMPKRGD